MTAVLETFMNQVVAAIGDDAVTHTYGYQSFGLSEAPPRVVWMRTGASFSTPRGNSWANPNRIYTMSQKVDVHVWGTSEEQADIIVGNELAALHRIANTMAIAERLQLGAATERWLTLGYAIILSITVDYAVLDEIKETGSFTTIAKAVVEPEDGWIDW